MKVFISYGREDQAIALKLYHDLKRPDITPWIDSEDILPGQNWKSEIRRAIQDCDYFIMLLSSKSLSAKGFVHKEQKIALDVFDECPQDKIFIIPARLDNCEFSDERLENLKPVDLFPSYSDGLNRILKAISSGKGIAQESVPNQDKPKEDTPNSSNQTSIGGDVVGGVVISGGGNTVNINSSGQSDKNPKSSEDESKPKTLSPMTYAVISLIAFVMGVGLLFLFIVKADNLIAQGIDARVFYILLIPLGLCAAAFLFGAMSSIAAYQGNVLDGRLRLGGPVVLFVLVVIGGFKLVPDTSSFDMTVFVHGPKGQLDLVLKNTGEVMIDLGGDRRTEKIGAKGEASFHSIPANFRTQPVSIAVIAEGFEPAKPDQKYELKAKSVYVEVKKDESRSKISGCVKDSDNNPLKDADIRIAGGLMVRTDSTGCFITKIPPEHQQQSIRLTASKDGYETWEGSVFPETGQEIRIVMSRKSPK